VGLTLVRSPVPVCDRCKHRRQKCDKKMDGCASCQAAGESCCFTDPETDQTLPRLYIKQLEVRLSELQARRVGASSLPPMQFILPGAHSPGFDFPIGRLGKRYLGDSSGLIFIRTCMSLAKAQGILKSAVIKPRSRGQARTTLGALPDLLPPADAMPLTRDRLIRLFEVFSDCQTQHSALNACEFEAHMDRFFASDSDPSHVSAACVHMVLAISLNYLGKVERNTTASKMAEMHYQKVLRDLPFILHRSTLESLQVLLLILQFSLSNPQQPVVWHIVGHALRISTKLGLHQAGPTDLPACDEDLRRRLFWSLYSIDRAVGNTLGR
jgi:hypothetical protein